MSALSPASAHRVQSWRENLPRSFDILDDFQPQRKRKAANQLQPSKHKRVPLPLFCNQANATSAPPHSPVTRPTSIRHGRAGKRYTSGSPQDVLKPPTKLQHTTEHMQAGEDVEPDKSLHTYSGPRYSVPQKLTRAVIPDFAEPGQEKMEHKERMEQRATRDARVELDEGSADFERTPRAQQIQRGISDVQSEASSANSTASSTISQIESTISRNDSAPSKSSSKQQPRSKSPVKMLDLAALDIRLEHLLPLIHIKQMHQLNPVHQVLQSVSYYTRSFAFLPCTAKGDVETHSELELDVEYYYDQTSHRETLGSLPPGSKICDIVQESIKAKTDGSSESDWNTSVHHLLMKAALDHSVYNDRLELRNVYIEST